LIVVPYSDLRLFLRRSAPSKKALVTSYCGLWPTA
jgi:hypothetical protein